MKTAAKPIQEELPALARSSAALLAVELVAAVLVAALTGLGGAGAAGWRVLFVSALLAAGVSGSVLLLDRRALRSPVRPARGTGLLLVLCLFAFALTLATVLLVALSVVPDAGSATVPLLVCGVVALLVLMFTSVAAGRSWRAVRVRTAGR